MTLRSQLFCYLLVALSINMLAPQSQDNRPLWQPELFYECNFHRQQFIVEDQVFGRLINQFRNSPESDQELAGFCFVPFVVVHCPEDPETGLRGYTNVGYNMYLAYWDEEGPDRYLQLFGVDTNKHVYRYPMIRSDANSPYQSLLDSNLAAALLPTDSNSPAPAPQTTTIPADFTVSDKGIFAPVTSMQLSFLSINELKYLLLGTTYLRQDTLGTVDAPDPDPDALKDMEDNNDYSGNPAPGNDEFANNLNGSRSVVIERAIATQSFRIGSLENASVQRFRTLTVRPGISDSLSSLGIRELAVAMTFIPYCPPDWYDNDGPSQFFQASAPPNFSDELITDPFRSLSLVAQTLDEKYELTTPESVLERLNEGPERYIPIWIYLVILFLLAIIAYLVFNNGAATPPEDGLESGPSDPSFLAGLKK